MFSKYLLGDKMFLPNLWLNFYIFEISLHEGKFRTLLTLAKYMCQESINVGVPIQPMLFMC